MSFLGYRTRRLAEKILFWQEQRNRSYSLWLFGNYRSLWQASLEIKTTGDTKRKYVYDFGFKFQIEKSMLIAGTILDYAENEDKDLNVIGSRGRSRFKKLLLGSVASAVVRYATCPVLVIK
jgi:nucleotide-binding universal stress UspA family protein